MHKEKKSAWRLVIILALLIVVVRLLGGCAKAVQVRQWSIPPVLIKDSAFTGDQVGSMRCDTGNNPVIHIEHKYYADTNAPIYLRLVHHEKIHARQAIYFGDCKGFVQRIANEIGFRLAIESEAYCAVYMTETSSGVPHLWSLKHIAENLSTMTGVPTETILERLPCQEKDDANQRQKPP